MPLMGPSRMAGGMAQSSSSSGIFFQDDGQSQVPGNSQWSSNFGGNSLSALPGHSRGIMGQVSGDISNKILNSVASPVSSVKTSSLLTDANSGLSGTPHLQRSASINTESYMRLPTSPMSFSSNNINISGSSAMDGSAIVQQNSRQDPSSQQTQHHQGGSSASSLPTSRMGQVQLPGGLRIPNSFVQDPSNIGLVQKKPRLDLKQEDILQQQVLQQFMQRQDSVQLQNASPQFQSLLQQQRLRQQQLLQSMPPMQRARFIQQQQQLQLRQQLQQQGVQPTSGSNRPYESGVCSRRLMQYLYHQRQRPTDNSISYWRKFVAEYYSPGAKKRWCLSTYDDIGHQSLGVFAQTATDPWLCDICGSKSGRGFEATFEVLPRLNEIKFGSGVTDELLFLSLPRECRFPSGMMMLEYAKAVQESVYEKVRVVREGQLRIIFTHDLKILSWEFCSRRHEELIPRSLISPQVKQLLQVAQECCSTLSNSEPDGVSQQDLQANSAMALGTGKQLARSLELTSLNDLGFSIRYVRCLQIAEIVNSMKDLMDFCGQEKVRPSEGLKNFAQHSSTTKIESQKTEEVEPSGISDQMNGNQQMVGPGASSGSAQSAHSLSSYQNLLLRQKSMNSTTYSLPQESSSSSPFNTASQTPSFMTPGSRGVLQNSPVSGFSNSQSSLQQLQLKFQHSMAGNSLQMPNQQASQQQMTQQLGGFNPSKSNTASGNISGHLSSRDDNVTNLPENIHLSDDTIQDIAREFYNDDLDDDMDFNWQV